MKLLVDIGNSAIKWAWWDGTCTRLDGRILWRGIQLAETLDATFDSSKSPTEILFAAVAGAGPVADFVEWAQGRWQVPLRCIETQARALGVTNAYAQATNLGVDRWLTLVAARARYPQRAVWIVDAGSAVTVDLLDAGGQHRGGLILPGLEMMHSAMRQGANALDVALDGAQAPHTLGRDTDTCMHQGILAAAAGAVTLAQSRMGESPLAAVNLITGGDASRMLPWLEGEWIHVEDFVFQGLGQYAEHAELGRQVS